WLRDALKDTYDCFNARYTPKSGEVVKNTTQGKKGGRTVKRRRAKKILKESSKPFLVISSFCLSSESGIIIK
ncbi:hypothetical protein AKJ49_01980, partial [candidate division MSBL1 archaeon SCGC-AAA382A03]